MLLRFIKEVAIKTNHYYDQGINFGFDSVHNFYVILFSNFEVWPKDKVFIRIFQTTEYLTHSIDELKTNNNLLYIHIYICI